MSEQNIFSYANILNTARLNATPIEQISKNFQQITRMDAYSIQETQMHIRIKNNEKIIGWKMGLTSEAKRKQMNLDSPLYGFLTNEMQVSNNDTFSLSGKIHPKIEPEIAFLISKNLSGDVTKEQVLDGCEGVAASLEILDSRYTQFKYFSMEDVIADNSSSSHFIIGNWRKIENLDLIKLNMKMYENNQLMEQGLSKNISGDPVLSVIELCKLLQKRNKILEAGSIVLAGAATTAIELKPDTKIRLEVDHFEPIQIKITP